MTQEEIIRMMKEAGFYFGKDDEFMPEWERFAALVAAHEREACAKVCEEFMPESNTAFDPIEEQLAAAIRARGEK